MTEQFLEDYLKNVAVHLVELQHTDESPAFYRIEDQYDLDEFDDAVRSMAKDHCLLLELDDSDIGEWDSTNDRPRIGLHLLIKVDKSQRKVARDRAKMILLKMVSIMRRDAQQYAEGTQVINGPLRQEKISFDSKVKMANMSAVDGNWYGKSIYFYLSQPLNLVFNSNWLI